MVIFPTLLEGNFVNPSTAFETTTLHGYNDIIRVQGKFLLQSSWACSANFSCISSCSNLAVHELIILYILGASSDPLRCS